MKDSGGRVAAKVPEACWAHPDGTDSFVATQILVSALLVGKFTPQELVGCAIKTTHVHAYLSLRGVSCLSICGRFNKRKHLAFDPTISSKTLSHRQTHPSQMLGILSGNKTETLKTTSLSIKNKKCRGSRPRPPERNAGRQRRRAGRTVRTDMKGCAHTSGENGGAARQAV